MCGRFANELNSVEAWDSFFDCDNSITSIEQDVTIGYNIAPTQVIPIVVHDSDCYSWIAARWGMVAPWAKEISTKYATFNARSETISEKATYKSAWKAGKRCVIPAIGYFEWKKDQDEKQPYFIHRDEPIFFGGLYEPSHDNICASCTMITLPASSAMSPMHHRMPLMFQQTDPWLNTDSFVGHIEALSWHAVDKTVNNPRNQGGSLSNPCND